MQSQLSDWGTMLRDEIEVATVESGLQLWWLGGASFALKIQACTAYLDLPYYLTFPRPSTGHTTSTCSPR